MMEQIKAVYKDYILFRIALCVGVASAMIVLYGVTGGFPPSAWRFLFDVLPRLTALWSTQGPALLLPLMALLLYALSLLVIWVALVAFAIKLGLTWLPRQGTSFEQDLQEAEELSEDMLDQIAEYEYEQQETYEMEEEQRFAVPRVMAAAPAMAVQSRYAVGGGAYPLASVAAAGTVYPIPTPPRKMRLESASSPSIPTTPRSDVPLQSLRREQLRLVPRQPVEDLPELDVDSAEQEQQFDLISNYSTIPELDRDELEQPTPSEQLSVQPLEAASLYKSALRLVTGIGLDPGLVRRDAPNEDSLIAFQCTRPGTTGPEPAGLFVVADGMGGHANGQEASKLAIQTISDAIIPALLNALNEPGLFMELLKDGVHRANLAIYQRNRQQTHMMGTTMTAALVIGNTAYVANVGDSRTYLYRVQDGLQAITHDHSLVAALLADGVITAEEVYTHPKRNQIFRCLGEHATVQIDTFSVTLQEGDLLMLCSDGLWEMVRDADMEEIIACSLPHASQISSALVQAALNRGGADNISTIAVCLAQM